MATPGNDHRRPARLSAEQSVELASHVAELARAGLPLEDGLRALADEARGRRPAAALRAMADRLESGARLDEVVQSETVRLPGHVRRLLTSAARSDRMPEVLHEFVDIQHNQAALRRRLVAALSYPIVLTVLMTLVFGFVFLYVADQYLEVLSDFEVKLPTMAEFLFRARWPMLILLAACPAAMLTALAAYLWLPGVRGVSYALYMVPLVGPIFRANRLAQFARWMALLLRLEVPLPEALRLTASAVRDGELAAGCRRAARAVEDGQPLSESLAALWQFPASLVPLVEWGEREAALAEAFRGAAETFDGRTVSREALLAKVLPGLLLLVIGFLLGLFILAILSPLAALMGELAS